MTMGTYMDQVAVVEAAVSEQSTRMVEKLTRDLDKMRRADSPDYVPAVSNGVANVLRSRQADLIADWTVEQMIEHVRQRPVRHDDPVAASLGRVVESKLDAMFDDVGYDALDAWTEAHPDWVESEVPGWSEFLADAYAAAHKAKVAAAS